jgi:hypothetical protein
MVMRNFSDKNEREQYVTEAIERAPELVEFSYRVVPKPSSHAAGALPQTYARIGLLPDGTVFANRTLDNSQKPENMPEWTFKAMQTQSFKGENQALADAIRGTYRACKMLGDRNFSDEYAAKLREFIDSSIASLKMKPDRGSAGIRTGR